MRPRKSLRTITTRQRFALIFVGVMILATGVLSLLQGRLEYRNVENAYVFAPFAILIGGLAIAVALMWGKRT